MTFKDWNIEAMTGYKPKTTFYTDFSIADAFGKAAVLETYGRAFENWHSNVEYITELCMVMSWKSFEHENDNLCELYSELYYNLNDWCAENLKGDDLSYRTANADFGCYEMNKIQDAKYFEVLLRWLKKQKGMKTCRMDDIQEVDRNRKKNGKIYYSVKAREKWFDICK